MINIELGKETQLNPIQKPTRNELQKREGKIEKNSQEKTKQRNLIKPNKTTEWMENGNPERR